MPFQFKAIVARTFVWALVFTSQTSCADDIYLHLRFQEQTKLLWQFYPNIFETFVPKTKTTIYLPDVIFFYFWTSDLRNQLKIEQQVINHLNDHQIKVKELPGFNAKSTYFGFYFDAGYAQIFLNFVAERLQSKHTLIIKEDDFNHIQNELNQRHMDVYKPAGLQIQSKCALSKNKASLLDQALQVSGDSTDQNYLWFDSGAFYHSDSNFIHLTHQMTDLQNLKLVDTLITPLVLKNLRQLCCAQACLEFIAIECSHTHLYRKYKLNREHIEDITLLFAHTPGLIELKLVNQNLRSKSLKQIQAMLYNDFSILVNIETKHAKHPHTIILKRMEEHPIIVPIHKGTPLGPLDNVSAIL